MKRLITDKKYEIQNARLVAEYNKGLDASNPEFCFEELYVKTTGEYFLYGRGGGMTSWSASNGENGEGIRLLTTKEAQEWIELHANDKYEYADLFGEAEE